MSRRPRQVKKGRRGGGKGNPTFWKEGWRETRNSLRTCQPVLRSHTPLLAADFSRSEPNFLWPKRSTVGQMLPVSESVPNTSLRGSLQLSWHSQV
eukprot:1844815-Rhodomonas_salina.1